MGKHAITQTIEAGDSLINILSDDDLTRIEDIARNVKLGLIDDNLDELRETAAQDLTAALEKLNQLSNN